MFLKSFRGPTPHLIPEGRKERRKSSDQHNPKRMNRLLYTRVCLPVVVANRFASLSVGRAAAFSTVKAEAIKIVYKFTPALSAVLGEYIKICCR